MIRSTLTFALCTALLNPVGSAAVAAADSCAAAVTETTLTDTFGSVGVLANLRGSDGSIRAVAQDLLAAALEQQRLAIPSCPNGCSGGESTIVYKVLPTAYLNTDRQRSECRQYERETSASPLRFTDHEFDSLDALNEWIMDFSRGKGADGKALYAACASNCSPRYTFLIKPRDGTTLMLDAEVVCGLARDKKETQYSLSTALRTNCSAAPDPAAAGARDESSAANRAAVSENRVSVRSTEARP